MFLKENSFCIYGLKIFIEKFEIDVEDLQYKIETYKEGDARNVNFRAVDNSKIYYVLNKETRCAI